MPLMNIRMQDRPVEERPREKLQRLGIAALSDFELLELLIGSGNGSASVTYVARRIKKILQQGNSQVTIEALLEINGVSMATASKIMAALEVSRRHLVRNAQPLLTHEDILGRLGEVRTRSQETFICMSLDGGQRMIAMRTITIGTLTMVIAHPREVFADVITDRAASIIVAHNHPSGQTKPSIKDISLTQQLVGAGQLLGISLRDHIIVTKTDFFSFRQHHLL